VKPKPRAPWPDEGKAMLSFHRKEQWDLDCWPWLCVHWRYANGSRRVFCLWSGGIQVGTWLWVWKRKRQWDQVKP
jgi:hypothetical protein